MGSPRRGGAMNPGPRHRREVGESGGRGPGGRGRADEGKAQERGPGARVDHRTRGLGAAYLASRIFMRRHKMLCHVPCARSGDGPRIRSGGAVNTGCWIWTSENNPSTHSAVNRGKKEGPGSIRLRSFFVRDSLLLVLHCPEMLTSPPS